MLLQIEEIQAGFDGQFLPLEPMLTGFRLVSSHLQRDDITIFQQHVNVILPIDFQFVLQRFDLARFTIGPIAFCNTGDYLSWPIELTEIR